MLSSRPEFTEVSPHAAAARLDARSIHLWRIPYAMSAGRAPLLALLSAYLGVPPSGIVLDQEQRGKPRLAPSVASRIGDRRLEFNWSHSGDHALVALALDCALGVDIERVGKNLRALEIAQRFFDPAEADTLARLDPSARDESFIALWCAKEAVLKAAGEGLSFGLSRLSFRKEPRGWTLDRTDPALGAIDAWRLEGFDPLPGYRGALAWQGDARRIVALRPPA
ncbi:MAG: 4'-phosphopantetheinyl transferase [Rhodanobacteraceae bacterium]|jgi:4'-phosphopantetheinyl transferase|nr:MAG: 4'-phosphopantetheinyl transferase [Rhodanobacteraceae bacterium]